MEKEIYIACAVCNFDLVKRQQCFNAVRTVIIKSHNILNLPAIYISSVELLLYVQEAAQKCFILKSMNSIYFRYFGLDRPLTCFGLKL